MMKPQTQEQFQQKHAFLIDCLKLKGLSQSSINAYSLGVRRAEARFCGQIDDLTAEQIAMHLSELLEKCSWTTVKLDFYGLRFYYENVLKKPWPAATLVKRPKVWRLPNVATLEQVEQIIANTKVLSYRVFFYVCYSLGLRISECIKLTVADIDADRMRVHVRNAKGRKDRLVILPQATLSIMRQFWCIHRHPLYLFPSRRNGRMGASQATTHLTAVSLQEAFQAIIKDCGIKKNSRPTVCDTAMQLTSLKQAFPS